MPKHEQQPTPNATSRSWCGARSAAWFAGALALSVPFNLCFRLPNGSFGYNILITLALAMAGIGIAVPVAGWLDGRLRHLPAVRRSALGQLAALAFLAIATGLVWLLAAGHGPSTRPFVDLLRGFGRWPFALILAGLVLVGFVLVCAIEARLPARARFSRRIRASLRRRWRCNWLFWSLVFVVLAGRDVMSVLGIADLNAVERTSALLGRVATQGVITLLFMLLFHGLRHITPRGYRICCVVLASMIPVVAIADYQLRTAWQQPLIDVINGLTSSGSFDIEREITASGIDVDATSLILQVLGVIALSVALFALFARLSARLRLRFRGRYIFAALGGLWLVAVAEGGLSHATKRVEAWQREQKSFALHINLFAPPRGMERIAIEFVEPFPPAQRERLLGEVEDHPGLRKPDIFVFMVESWRADTVNEVVTPYLARFRREECQPLGDTFAGSNCTPLSWFTFFHSRLALHWPEATDVFDDAPDAEAAYPLRVLDKLGYQIECRAVCDLGYKNLGGLNFGRGDGLIASHYLDCSDGGPRDADWRVSTTPDREEDVMRELRDHLDTDPAAPQFQFISLDSPHYNYYWPDGFAVLHDDCATHVSPTMRGDPETVGKVRRRYENAVNSIDDLLGGFIEYLKVRGRFEDSLIIITGDHGEEFKEEGSWFHCSALNHYQTAVPIIVKWPASVGDAPPQTNVTHLDLMPSVLHMIGLDAKFYQPLSGRSLLDYGGPPREAVVSTYNRGLNGTGLCLISGDTKAKFTFGRFWSHRVPDHLYIAEYSDLDDRLVDPRADLGDRTHADLLRELYPTFAERFTARFERD